MRRKHDELGYSYQEKCRKLVQVQELYDKTKRKAELGQMEAAASDAIDSNPQFGPQLSEVDLLEPAKRQGHFFYGKPSEFTYQNSHHHPGSDRERQRRLVGGGSGLVREDMAWSKPEYAPGKPSYGVK